LELKWRSSLYTAKLFLLFPSEFTEGQNQFNQWSRLDGSRMKQQIEEKLAEGFYLRKA
jgi:hypothetical protein